MIARKGQPARRAASLEQYRCPLWRRLAQVVAFDIVELSVVADLAHFVGVRIDALAAISQHGVIGPAALKQLVQHLEVFISLVVATVMLGLLGQAHGARRAVQIAGDDVPADSPIAQVIQGRETAGEEIRRFIREVGRKAETEVAGNGGHGGHQQQRVVDRQLDGFLQRYVQRLAVDIVGADDVGDEQSVEQAPLQQARQIGPVFEGLVLGRRIARVRPQAMVDMPHTVHVEGIEQDLPGH